MNAEDFDGWTPLHAAAHWGQKEACEILVENFCDMDKKNYVVIFVQSVSKVTSPGAMKKKKKANDKTM